MAIPCTTHLSPEPPTVPLNFFWNHYTENKSSLFQPLFLTIFNKNYLIVMWASTWKLLPINAKPLNTLVKVKISTFSKFIATPRNHFVRQLSLLFTIFSLFGLSLICASAKKLIWCWTWTFLREQTLMHDGSNKKQQKSLYCIFKFYNLKKHYSDITPPKVHVPLWSLITPLAGNNFLLSTFMTLTHLWSMLSFNTYWCFQGVQNGSIAGNG